MWCQRDDVLARADLTHDRTLGDGAPARDGDRAELEQRHRIPVGRLDRERAAAGRNGTDERDAPADRCTHRLAGGGADVDPAVLSRRVLVGRERERPQDRPVDRPGPAGRDGDEDQGCDRSDDREGEHTPQGYRLRDVEGNCVHASGASQRLFNDSE